MGYDEEPAYVLAAAATFIALGTIVVGLRLYTRTVQKVKIGPDDWLILPGLVKQHSLDSSTASESLAH